MGDALLKDRIDRFGGTINQHINDERWSDIAENVKAVLKRGGAFKPWEADAIADAMIETVREHGTLVESALFTKLHARQIDIPLAKTLAALLVKSFA